MRTLLLSTLLLLALPMSTLPAQVPHGHALVAWKPGNPTATGGMRLVDRSGANTVITGLAPETIGTTRWDGAQAVLVTTTGSVIAGLGTDNRTGSSPLPLDLRSILISGSNAVVDAPFATLMQVPAGQLWKVSDIKERPDGSCLVAATEILATANPMPQTAVFLVTPTGVVTVVPTSGIPAGSLEDLADAGDRFVVGVLQSGIIVNALLWSMPYSPAGLPPYQICQFVNTTSIGGLDLDVDGTILIAIKFQGGSVARVTHAPSSTPVLVASTPTSAQVADVLPGPALLAVFEQPTLLAGPLHLVDANTGMSTLWTSAVVRDPVDVSVRADTAVYGPPSQQSSVPAWLGSEGGWPTLGNTAYGLRAGGKPGASGAVLLGLKRASIALPFGTLLVDPALLLVLPSFVVPRSGAQHIALGIPNDPGLTGGVLDMQGAVVDLTASTIDLTRGLELTVF